jgi:5-methylcytosine-specific restriction endonuclease McrA
MPSQLNKWSKCLLCFESFNDVAQHKHFLQLCEGCGINHHNKVSRQNKRVKREGYEGKLYLINWVYVMHMNGYSCVHCKKHGSQARLTLDHILPLSRGGKNEPDNIQPLCIDCHVIKDQYV